MRELPKLIISDIDGVWTDGGMYYDEKGNELKKFNTKDSVGVKYLKLFNIPLAIVTGENTKIVKKRAAKLEVDYLFMGVKNKVFVVQELISKLGINIAEVAFIGDEINDLELLKLVGLSASPRNGSEFVQKKVDYVLNTNGGEGVFKEFVLLIFELSEIHESQLYEVYKKDMESTIAKD